MWGLQISDSLPISKIYNNFRYLMDITPMIVNFSDQFPIWFHNTQYSIALKQIYINVIRQHIFQTSIHQIRSDSMYRNFILCFRAQFLPLNGLPFLLIQSGCPSRHSSKLWPNACAGTICSHSRRWAHFHRRLWRMNGIRNTMHATKKNNPPIKPSISPLLILVAMKKAADRTNNSHPHSWSFLSLSPSCPDTVSLPFSPTIFRSAENLRS